jgi:hypothetical protein
MVSPVSLGVRWIMIGCSLLLLSPASAAFSPYKLCELGSETANLVQNPVTNDWTIESSPTNSSVTAKPCWCVTRSTQAQYYPFYCPAQFDTCRIDVVDNDSNWRVTCLLLNQGGSKPAGSASDWVVPFLGPFVVLLYIGLLMALFCSRKGNLARDYFVIHCRLFLGSCWRSIWYTYFFRRHVYNDEVIAEESLTWNERHQAFMGQSLDRTTRRYRVWVRLLLHDGVANERADLQARGEVDPMLAPTHLELRTKIYQSEEEEIEEQNVGNGGDAVDIEAPRIQDSESVNKNDKTAERTEGEGCAEYSEEEHQQYHHDNEDGNVICAICMGEVENGDRIGNLHCRHLFHVDCLKQWLRKKNECPMCSAKDVATRRAASS